MEDIFIKMQRGCQPFAISLRIFTKNQNNSDNRIVGSSPNSSLSRRTHSDNSHEWYTSTPLQDVYHKYRLCTIVPRLTPDLPERNTYGVYKIVLNDRSSFKDVALDDYFLFLQSPSCNQLPTYQHQHNKRMEVVRTY